MEEDIKMSNEYLTKNLIASEEEIEEAIKLYNDKKRMKDCLIELNYILGITKRTSADIKEKKKIEQKIQAIVLLEVENEYIKEQYKELEKNSIPVSLVKEKIEELNEYYKKEIYPSLMNWSDVDITEYHDGMIGILQELLEKRR